MLEQVHALQLQVGTHAQPPAVGEQPKDANAPHQGPIEGPCFEKSREVLNIFYTLNTYREREREINV